MLYICDFFTRHKEAVSNQIELLATTTNGQVLAATRFMGQKPLRKSELKDHIFLLPDILYKLLLPFIIIATYNKPIHYFEEEPSIWKRLLLNRFKRPLYISMYRRPNKAYAEHVNKYHHLQNIFVELEEHKNILVDHGVSAEKIVVAHTPAKLQRKRSTKKFDSKNVTMAFASWNNKEKNALHDRGLLYLLDVLEKNPNFRLEIALRDNKTREFLSIASEKGIRERVVLHDITSSEHLITMFEGCDFVVFTAQARVVKDVPNSLLDGLMLGKPIIISDVIDFHKTVADNDIGIVVAGGTAATKLKITSSMYTKLSENAYIYSKRHSTKSYLKIINHYRVRI